MRELCVITQMMGVGEKGDEDGMVSLEQNLYGAADMLGHIGVQAERT